MKMQGKMQSYINPANEYDKMGKQKPCKARLEDQLMELEEAKNICKAIKKTWDMKVSLI